MVYNYTDGLTKVGGNDPPRLNKHVPVPVQPIGLCMIARGTNVGFPFKTLPQNYDHVYMAFRNGFEPMSPYREVKRPSPDISSPHSGMTYRF